MAERPEKHYKISQKTCALHLEKNELLKYILLTHFYGFWSRDIFLARLNKPYYTYDVDLLTIYQ